MEEWQLQSQFDFEREYKELENLIREVKSTAQEDIYGENMGAGQTNFKEINNNLANEIYSFNESIETKLHNFTTQFDKLEEKVSKFKKNTRTMIDSYKKVLEKVETAKTEDLLTNEVKGQLAYVKNLFFKKVLRSIVVGEEKSEENINYYRSKLALKDRLLRKSLMAAEFYKSQIDDVKEEKQTLKKSLVRFMEEVDDSIGFGSVRLSNNLGFNELRKIQSKDFRIEDMAYTLKLQKKDLLLCAKSTGLFFYETLNSTKPVKYFSMRELKEIQVLRGSSVLEGAQNSTQRSYDKNKNRLANICFLVKLKNEKGGFIMEFAKSKFRKWDYIFFIFNLVINYPALSDEVFKPFNYEYNLTKIFKLFNIKHWESIPLRETFTLDKNRFKITDIVNKKNFKNESITSWKIVEECSNLAGRLEENFKKGVITNERETQTDPNITGFGDGMIKKKEDEGRLRLENLLKTEIDMSKFEIKNYDEDSFGVKRLNDKRADKLPDNVFSLFERKYQQNTRNKRRRSSGFSYNSNKSLEFEEKQPEVDLDESIDSDEVPKDLLIFDDDEQRTVKKEKKPRKSKKSNNVDKVGSNFESSKLFLPFLGDRSDPSALVRNRDNLIDNFNFEKSTKAKIIRTLLNGYTAKGSGLQENSGEYIIKLNNVKQILLRKNIRTGKKDVKKVEDIKSLVFDFEYRNPKRKNMSLEAESKERGGGENKKRNELRILGAAVTKLVFTDSKNYWEFKTKKGLKNDHRFFTSLLIFRLNRKDFNF